MCVLKNENPVPFRKVLERYKRFDKRSGVGIKILSSDLFNTFET